VILLSLVRVAHAWRLAGRARPIETSELEGFLKDCPLPARSLRVLETDELRSPAVFGLWRPAVLLPRNWREQFTAGELGCVMAHELGHIRRWDLWWRWAFLLAKAAHWFNPLVWVAARCSSRDQELACDEWVTARHAFAAPELYGETLLKVAGLLSRAGAASLAQVAMAETKADLAVRIRQIALQAHPKRYALPVALALVVLGNGVLGPAPQAKASGQAKEPSPATVSPVTASPASASPASESPTIASSATASPATPAQPDSSNSQPKNPATEPASPQKTEPPMAGRQTEKRQLVEIEAKFVEIQTGPNGRNADALAEIAGAQGSGAKVKGASSVLSESELQDLLHRLNQRKGVDLLAGPRVQTRSGQKAILEIIREFRYPSTYEIDPKDGQVTPSKFETGNTGVTLELLPTVSEDGIIDLVVMPKVVEFEGFINYGKGFINYDAANPGTPTNGDGLDRLMQNETSLNTEQVINQPIFSTLKITTAGSVRPGQTLLIGGLTRDSTREVEEENLKTGRRKKWTETIQGHLFVFVTARITDKELPQTIEGKAVDANQLKKEAKENAKNGSLKLVDRLLFNY
jgi:hypothetical protein